MKDRQILLSAQMVNAILDGRKAQTRRVVKPQPIANHRGKFNFTQFTDDEGIESYWQNQPFWWVRCPFGKDGDNLWVRETWAAQHGLDDTRPREMIQANTRLHYAATEDRGGLLWRPSIHMPRWASRITLEITGIRVERLNEISRGDAMEEGCPFPNMASGPDPIKWFSDLWESITGEGSWNANPYVWVIEFTRIGTRSLYLLDPSKPWDARESWSESPEGKRRDA